MHTIIGFKRVMFDGYVGPLRQPSRLSHIYGAVKLLASEHGDPATSHFIVVMANGQEVNVKPKNRIPNPNADKILNATLP